MLARTFIIIGFTLGILGTLGETLMLLTSTPGANMGVLFLWIGILALSIYFQKKH